MSRDAHFTRQFLRQKQNVIFVTINLPDVQESTIEYDLTPTSISFKGRAGK